MLAAGIETAAQLAERVGLPRQTVAAWLARKRPTVDAERLDKVARTLDVRLGWLVSGEGLLARRARYPEEVQKAASLMERMTQEQCDRWFAEGERILKKR